MSQGSLNTLLPLGMNIELTDKCPLRCPQCYCSLEGTQDIPFEIAAKYVRQAKDFGIKHIELSGGETLCYPHLYDLVKLIHDIGLEVNTAISGWHFTEACLTKLVEAGLDNIFVSLNGPTEEINRLTRDGYQYAISALQLLQSKNFPNVYINWVMHRNNADSLPEMIQIGKKYSVRAIVILAPKPTSKHELNTLPSFQQLENTVRIIRDNASGFIKVESCFSPLLAMLRDTRLLGNLNIGRDMGCGAGRNQLSVSVNGMLSPCRHLEFFEEWDTLEEYWRNSEILKKIRGLEGHKQEPCISCKFCNHCRHCLAINTKLTGKLFIGNDFCPLKSEYKLLTVAEQ